MMHIEFIFYMADMHTRLHTLHHVLLCKRLIIYF